MKAIEEMIAHCSQLKTNEPGPELKNATGVFLSGMLASRNRDPYYGVLDKLSELPPAGAAWVAVAFGTAIEKGLDPKLSGRAVMELFQWWLLQLPAPSKDRSKKANPTDHQEELLASMPWLGQSVVSHVAKMPEYREELASDPVLIQQLQSAEEYTYAAIWVRELLERRSGKLLVLHAESGRAMSFKYQNIGNCFHLFSLLQMAIGRQLPGGRTPNDKIVEVASGQKQARVNDTACWHYGNPQSPQPDLAGLIAGEASVEVIPVIGDTQVMILWPPIHGARKWDSGFFGPFLQAASPGVQLEEELSEERARSWFQQLGIKDNAISMAQLGMKPKPWWKFW